MADLLLIPVASLSGISSGLEMDSCDISLIWMARKKDEGALPHLEQLVLGHIPTFQMSTCGTSLAHVGDIYCLLQRIEVLDCTISAESDLQAISCHLFDVCHIQMIIEGLMAHGLVSLEEIPTLECLGLCDNRHWEVCTLATRLLSSCLTLPLLKVLEWQEAEEMLRKGLPQCWVIVAAGLPQTKDWWRSASKPLNSRIWK